MPRRRALRPHPSPQLRPEVRLQPRPVAPAPRSGSRPTGLRRLVRAALLALLPVTGLSAPVLAQDCPDLASSGQTIRYNGQALRTAQRQPVTAGGALDLGACGFVQGHGHVGRRADITLDFARNNPGYDLDIRVEGQCDTVLLLRGPDGQTLFNDDAEGLDPALRLTEASPGRYSLWIGTVAGGTCPAELVLQTSGGGPRPQPPAPQPPAPVPPPVVPPVVPPIAPPVVPPPQAACPNPAADGLALTYASPELHAGERVGVTAGGAVNLEVCPGVPGHGRVTRDPAVTLTLTQAIPGTRLTFAVDAPCDTLLLVRGPDGRYQFNDDSRGLNPDLAYDGARAGAYDLWVGTFGAESCRATLRLQTSGGGIVPPILPPVVPQPPRPAACPDARLEGQRQGASAAELLAGRSTRLTAGGPVDLAACAAVSGGGHVSEPPQVTLFLRDNPGAFDLEVAVAGRCDPVLLLRGPDGQWRYNDDADGLDSRLRIPRAAPGAYALWAGTFGAEPCQATLTTTTIAPPPAPMPQPPIPAPPPPPPPPTKAGTCPDPRLDGQPLRFSAQGLWSAQSLDLVAGGNLDVSACGAVDAFGYLVQRPDATLTLTDNPEDHALEFRLSSDCDPVLLVHGPDGEWAFSDDLDGLNPRLRLENAEPGAYDLWAGTFGPETCPVTLVAETFPSIAPRPERPGEILADPGNMTLYRGRNGQQFRFQVTGASGGAIWGTDVYTDDSPVALAAVHAGILRPGQTGVVTVVVEPGQAVYAASARNGVSSAAFGRWSGSYRFLPPDSRK